MRVLKAQDMQPTVVKIRWIYFQKLKKFQLFGFSPTPPTPILDLS